jgi:hypothetical protein
LIAGAATEDRGAERERDDEHQRRQRAEEVVVESGEDGEEHEPDDGVQPLLDQESASGRPRPGSPTRTSR